jgi:hypothetical protein
MEDLYQVEGKAELVDGEIVLLPPWDVDLLRADVVQVYRASDPDHPTIYRRGDIAEAEPAVPGWRMAVDDLFR